MRRRFDGWIICRREEVIDDEKSIQRGEYKIIWIDNFIMHHPVQNTIDEEWRRSGWSLIDFSDEICRIDDFWWWCVDAANSISAQLMNSITNTHINQLIYQSRAHTTNQDIWMNECDDFNKIRKNETQWKMITLNRSSISYKSDLFIATMEIC